jgi:hypothetical protein
MPTNTSAFQLVRNRNMGPFPDSLKFLQSVTATDAIAGETGGISVSIGKPGEGNSDEDIVVRLRRTRPCFAPTSLCPLGRCFDPRGTPACSGACGIETSLAAARPSHAEPGDINGV